MFEFLKLCNEYEKMTTLERGAVLAAKSAKVLAKLHLLDIPGIDPVETLVSFIIGATADGGKINEREYLAIYPALVTAFGPGYDFYSVKHSFDGLIATKRIIRQSVSTLTAALALTSEITLDDLVLLYALILTPTLGKLPLKLKLPLARLTLKPTGKAGK